MHVIANSATIDYLEAMEILIRFGIEINEQDKDGNTALHIAATHGDTQITRLLITQQADVSIRNNLGQTPMHVIANSAARDFSEAMARDSSETMEVLTETKTNPEEDYDDKKASMATPYDRINANKPYYYNVTVYQLAIINGDINLIKEVVYPN